MNLFKNGDNLWANTRSCLPNLGIAYVDHVD